METNMYDDVGKRVQEFMGATVDRIAQNFKKTNPYNKEPVSNDELIYGFDTRGFEIFENIANTEGLPQAILYRDKMMKLKQGRVK